MKIALILPYDSTYRYKKGSFDRRLKYPPLTLTTLASVIPSELNAKIRIIDEGVEAFVPEELDEDIIGITAVTATATRAYQLADTFRNKGIKVVLGGPHPTVLPEEAAKHADSVVIGFGEKTFPELLWDFKSNKMKKFYSQKGNIDLSSLPYPRRDLLKKERYLTPNTVMATRGCPHKCKFCSIPALRKNFYKRPIPDVIEEIKHIGEKRFIFLDPSPTEDISYTKALWKKLRPLGINWVGLSTVNIFNDPEAVDLARKSGCIGILFGFETVNQIALRNVYKNFNKVQKYKEIIAQLHDKGIGVLGCFILGFDEDDSSIFERTLKFIDEIKIDLVRYTILTPFPGTAIYNDFKKQGRLIENDWKYFDYEHVVFKPLRMTPEELEEGLSWLWRQTYTIPRIAKRIFNIPKKMLLGLACNLGFRYHAFEFDKIKEKAY